MRHPPVECWCARQQVILSAFSQRPDRQTGWVEDQCLYSDFGNLDDVDLVAAFEQFELRRSMSKTGVFQPIDPLALCLAWGAHASI